MFISLLRQSKRRHFYQLFLRESFQCLLDIRILFLLVKLFVVSVNFVHIVLDKLVLTVVLQIVTIVLRILLSTFWRVDKSAHSFQIQIWHELQFYVCIGQKLDVADALLSLV